MNLTDKEQFELKSSCNFITFNKIEVFVVNFYESFLNEKTLKFLHQNSNESLINMFTSFLNIIFLYLDDPSLVEDHISAFQSKHPNFKVMMSFSDFFIEAFMKSLKKSLGSDFTDVLEKIWFKTVSAFVTYFKSKLS